MAPRPWLALSGGVGGAKLVLGLAHALADPAHLLAVANTGDDFEHLGLTVCPDVDTLTYTLAGLADPLKGWGRADETGGFMAALAALGGETWFFLGDRDLAVHVERTRRLRAGEALSTITADIARRLGVPIAIAPMSDDPVRTVVDTDRGALAFQHYFVRERCEPRVRALRFEGAAAARPSPALLARLADPDLAGIVICPSNPLISIDPILALPGVREALRSAAAPVIAVSPIVAGHALKGPTAKMLGELGRPVSAAAVAAHYGDLIDGFVLDVADAALAPGIAGTGPAVRVCPAVMRSLDDRVALARAVIDFADELGEARRAGQRRAGMQSL